jgi:hypothetical protein
MGPYGVMPPEDMKRFFGVMLELQPVRKSADLMPFLLPGALALIYTAAKLWACRSRPAGWLWLYVSVCGAVALWLGQKFMLFVEFPAAFAAGLLPIALNDVSAALAAVPRRAVAARLSILFMMLLAPHLPAYAGPRPKPAGKPYPSCSLRHADRFLAPYAGQIALADVQATPELLWRTGVLTVGSLYQHGVPGFLRARAAWRSKDAKQPSAEVEATGSKIILFCPQQDRYALVVDLPGTTLWDALQAGRPPPWLHQVANDESTGWQVFAIHS